MPIEGINQPGYLEINSELRLRAYGGHRLPAPFRKQWFLLKRIQTKTAQRMYSICNRR